MTTVEITLDNFADTVREHPMLVLDFWAAWCGPCRSFAPVFEAAAEAHPDIVFGKIDTETQPELSSRFGITSIPTIMAIREGINVFAQPGALPAPMLEQVIQALRALDMDAVRTQLNEQASAQLDTQADVAP